MIYADSLFIRLPARLARFFRSENLLAATRFAKRREFQKRGGSYPSPRYGNNYDDSYSTISPLRLKVFASVIFTLTMRPTGEHAARSAGAVKLTSLKLSVLPS